MSLEKNASYKIKYELSQIEKEFDIISLLGRKLAISSLDPIELRAAATSMQSIYNGYEKILIILLKNYNYPIPNEQSWHSNLLLLSKDKGFISEELESELRDLMGFRHFVRHAYSFMLDNDLLEPLLKKMIPLFDLFKNDIEPNIK